LIDEAWDAIGNSVRNPDGGDWMYPMIKKAVDGSPSFMRMWQGVQDAMPMMIENQETLVELVNLAATIKDKEHKDVGRRVCLLKKYCNLVGSVRPRHLDTVLQQLAFDAKTLFTAIPKVSSEFPAWIDNSWLKISMRLAEEWMSVDPDDSFYPTQLQRIQRFVSASDANDLSANILSLIEKVAEDPWSAEALAAANKSYSIATGFVFTEQQEAVKTCVHTFLGKVYDGIFEGVTSDHLQSLFELWVTVAESGQLEKLVRTVQAVHAQHLMGVEVAEWGKLGNTIQEKLNHKDSFAGLEKLRTKVGAMTAIIAKAEEFEGDNDIDMDYYVRASHIAAKKVSEEAVAAMLELLCKSLQEKAVVLAVLVGIEDRGQKRWWDGVKTVPELDAKMAEVITGNLNDVALKLPEFKEVIASQKKMQILNMLFYHTCPTSHRMCMIVSGLHSFWRDNRCLRLGKPYTITRGRTCRRLSCGTKASSVTRSARKPLIAS